MFFPGGTPKTARRRQPAHSSGCAKGAKTIRPMVPILGETPSARNTDVIAIVDMDSEVVVWAGRGKGGKLHRTAA